MEWYKQPKNDGGSVGLFLLHRGEERVPASARIHYWPDGSTLVNVLTLCDSDMIAAENGEYWMGGDFIRLVPVDGGIQMSRYFTVCDRIDPSYDDLIDWSEIVAAVPDVYNVDEETSFVESFLQRLPHLPPDKAIHAVLRVFSQVAPGEFEYSLPITDVMPKRRSSGDR